MSIDNNQLRQLREYLGRRAETTFDAESEKQLRELWESSAEAPAASAEAADAIERTIRLRGRKSRLGSWLKISAAAAVAALIFAGGYLVASRTMPSAEAMERTLLVTASGSVGSYTLPDGTQVWLNSSSSLEYTSDFAENRHVKLTGEGYFDVKRDTIHPFTVEMDHIDVRVLGTAFDARCYGDGRKEDVVLRRGSVELLASGNDGRYSARLEPNQRFIFDPKTSETKLMEVEATNYCRWMERRITFSNVPLADILTNLERKYNVEISVDSSVMTSRRYSLTVDNEPIDDVMVVLAAVTRTQALRDAEGNISLAPLSKNNI